MENTGWARSQRSNDCVITAIANYTGEPYDKVERAAIESEAITYLGFTLSSKVPEILDRLGYETYITNGIRIWNGLFRFTTGPRANTGHMVPVVDGHAYESNGYVWPLSARRLWNMRGYAIRKKGNSNGEAKT